MGTNILVVGSIVALVERVIAVIVLGLVLHRQFQLFFKANLFKSEGKLKALLFYMVLFTLIANIPIMYLHWQRILNLQASNDVTAVATVFNASSTVVVAVLLFLIYGRKDNRDYEGDEDDDSTQNKLK